METVWTYLAIFGIAVVLAAIVAAAGVFEGLMMIVHDALSVSNDEEDKGKE